MPAASLWPLTLPEGDKQDELRRFHALELSSEAVLLRFLQRLMHCRSMQLVWTWHRGALFQYGDVLFFVELSWDKRTLQQSVRWTHTADGSGDSVAAETHHCHCSRWSATTACRRSRRSGARPALRAPSATSP